MRRNKSVLMTTVTEVRLTAKKRSVLPVAKVHNSLNSRPRYRPKTTPGANARSVVFKGKKIYEGDWDVRPAGASWLLCSTSYVSAK